MDAVNQNINKTPIKRSKQTRKNKKQSSNNKNKILYLEFLRGLAIFFVIFNHTGTLGFSLFSTFEPASANFFIALMVAIFCKFSVPVFFAISGALSLGKAPEPLGELWLKKVFKFSLILIIISFVYYIETNYNSHGYRLVLEKGWIKDFIVKLCSGDIRSHLWYMYAFIAYLIGLPLLQSLVKNLETKHYYYMVGITIFMSCIVPFTYFFAKNDAFRISPDFNLGWICTNIVLYPCLGYFMHNKLEIKHRFITPIILWIVNICSIGLCAYVTYLRIIETKTFEIEAYHTSLVVINTICIFVTAKIIFENAHLIKPLDLYVKSLGSCTFGIYLLHMIVKDQQIFQDLLDLFINIGLHKLLSVLVYVYVLMIVSWILSFVISKIPILKKLIGM